MSDWQVGDLAVCVDASQIIGYDAGELTEQQKTAGLRFLVKGRVYTVRDINPHPCGLSIFMCGQPTPAPYAASRFRKIRPDEHQACEEEFVTLLQRSKVPEPADGYDDFIRGGVPGVSGTVETRLATVVRIVRRGK